MTRLSDLDFNRRFLLELDRYNPKLKHLATGSNRRHPLLRLVLLRACKEDIKADGLQAAQERWQHFIGGIK